MRLLRGAFLLALGTMWSLTQTAPAQGEIFLLHSSFDEALKILMKTEKGKELLETAAARLDLENPKAISKLLRWGTTSRTDAVLERQFDEKSGVEIRKRKVLIYLRKDQPLASQILDLAHELVHAAHEPEWDPYDPDLTLAKYIRASIEGRGGEVQALKAECEVAVQLAPHFTSGNGQENGAGNENGKFDLNRCSRYLTGSLNPVSQTRILSDFYRVGQWYGFLLERLGENARFFPKLSKESPELYSSTGRAPYPVALMTEYQQITRVACQNSLKRGERLAQSDHSQAASSRSISRAPAGIQRAAAQSTSLPLYLTPRCQAQQ